MAEAPISPTPTADVFPLDIPAGTAPPPAAQASGTDLLYPTDAPPPADVPTAAVETPPVAESVSLATGGEPTDAAPPPDPEAPAPLTPDSYTLALPEGFTLDDTLMSEAKTLFAEAKLDPKSAQPLVDIYVKALQAQAAQAAATAQEWLTASNALPEFQGEMRKTSLATIGRFMDEYGSPEVKQVLEATGLGNHPALVKLIHNAAKALNEGGPVPSGTPTPQGRNGRPAPGSTPGQIMYGDSAASN